MGDRIIKKEVAPLDQFQLAPTEPGVECEKVNQSSLLWCNLEESYCLRVSEGTSGACLRGDLDLRDRGERVSVEE